MGDTGDSVMKAEGRRKWNASAEYTDLLKTHPDIPNCCIDYVQTVVKRIHFRNCKWIALNETANCSVRNAG